MEHKSTAHGFTLVELITVITILGILSVAVLPRFIQADAAETRTAQDKIISADRLAQQLAMSKPVSANVQLVIDNSNKRLRIQYSEGGTQIIDTPLPSACTVTSQTLTFDKRGFLAGGSAADISINGGASTIRIEASGYAHTL